MSQVHVIKVPDVGEGVAEVELVAWHVQFGDQVAEDQVLADVMTDKASVEIPSPVAGRVVALGGEVGQTLAVGSELMRIEIGAAGAASPPPPRPVTAAPAPASIAAAAAPRPAAPAAPAAAPAPRPAVGQRPIASPALRRRAWELGVDLAEVRASGPAGRIVHADLDAWVATHPCPAPRAAAASAAPAPAAGVERNDQQVIPVIGLRRRIAMRLQDAKRRIPHFSYVEELDVTELEALRAALNARWKAERGHLTLLPLLMRALVLALREVPQCNALFDDEAGVVTRHGAVHIGVATQTPHGLLVPVLRHAEARNLWTMAAEVARLADEARAGRATRGDLSGSTITLSSLGALGGIVSTPIINAPEVAIVGVNRIVEKPVVRNGAVVVRKTMNLSSSFDHRVVDGADGARLIQAVRQRVETPALLFVDD
jgi:2-oxoisovalerate dehydrogenase E2 component (dihydrolipoyl transacylase)